MRLYRLPAFTLIELSIVLVIVGVIMGAVFKGKDVLDAARLRSILDDYQTYRMALLSYQDLYHALPGDDAKASSRFGEGVENGDGNGVIEGNEGTLFWAHLSKAGLGAWTQAPTSKLGGRYMPLQNSPFPGLWLRLGKETDGSSNGGFLTPQQAQHLKAKSGEDSSFPQQGALRFSDGEGFSGQCIKNGMLNTMIKDPVCVVFLKMD